MHATQPPPPAKPSTVEPSPADLLRQAARYLAEHGWIQGSYYADPDAPSPAACAVGALAIAAYGYPNPNPYLHTLEPHGRAAAEAWQRFITAETALATYLGIDGLDPVDEVCTIHTWNDVDGRTATDVIDTLNAAADDLDTEEAAS